MFVKTIDIRDSNMVSFTYAEKETKRKILIQNTNTMLSIDVSHYLPQLEILHLKIDHMR